MTDSDRKGILWDAMRVASDIIEINREAMATGQAFNADVSPIIHLVERIVDQCATIATQKGIGMCGDSAIVCDQIAEEIRELTK